MVKQYSTKFKLKLVLEALKGEQTTSQIASKYETTPRNIQKWRKQFLENAELALNKEHVIKEYSDKLDAKNKELDELYKELGKLTAQLNWAKKKIDESEYRN